MTRPRNIDKLSLERLRQVLDYDPVTGLFTWRQSLGPMCKAREIAGCIKKDGYRRIAIDGRSYPASNLAWFHFHGERALGIVDHKNLLRADDRLENLRPATFVQNAHNRPTSGLSTTRLKGASRFNSDRNLKRFRSTITVNGKRIHLGQFDTAEEAHEAYAKKAAELHGAFARTE